MKALILAAIHFYRRFISSRKGFSCAHRVHNGGPSCSAYGYRAVQRHGALTGLALIRRRLRRCGKVYRNHFSKPSNALGRNPAMRHQAGFCDAGCDVPTGDCGSCDLPAADCGSCDLPASDCSLQNEAADCAISSCEQCSPSACDPRGCGLFSKSGARRNKQPNNPGDNEAASE